MAVRSIESVSIPSSLSLESVLKPPTLADKRLSRLRESGIAVVRCPDCGCEASREEVLVHRPGEVSVRRILLRCQAPGRGCGVRVESEEPVLPGTRPRMLETPLTCRTGGSRPVEARTRPQLIPPQIPKEVPMQTTSPVVCACGCGREFHPQRPSQRFATTSCRNRFNSRARREREKVVRTGGPLTLLTMNRPNAPQATPRMGMPTLAELAAWLIELSPEQEIAVRELVRLERDRRTPIAS